MADILIIEDDLALRSEIERFLEAEGHTVALESDGTEALSLLKSCGFDVIVLDIKLGGISGLEVLKKLHSEFPIFPPVIIMTGHGDKATAISALHFGAFEFLEKPFKPSTLKEAIARALSEKNNDALGHKAFVSSQTDTELTEREREVAFLASEGLSNEKIAEKLGLGAETVKTHLKKVFRKLGVSNRTALGAKLRKVA